MQIVYGVKGKSVFHSLPGFDVIRNNPVDYMHCVLLGVVRTLISLRLHSKKTQGTMVSGQPKCYKWWCNPIFYVNIRTLETKSRRQMQSLQE